MALSMKQSHAISEMAKVLYGFLPGSGSRAWKGHVTFASVARDVGVGGYWPGGSKEPAIATLLEQTLDGRPDLFEKLLLSIVREGMKYRQKGGNPVKRGEIEILNGLIVEVGFKFSDLWDEGFLAALQVDGAERAAAILEREAAKRETAAATQSEHSRALEAIKKAFYELAGLADRQEAGRRLEGVLNNLFALFGLDPREPFRVVGEQIDGSFVLDNEHYLVEAKWEKDSLSEAPLSVFREKVASKSTVTRGVFIALNGCTSDALDAITRGKQPNFFLLDGYDLSLLLEGRMRLDDLLRAKLRRLAEEGKVFVSARDFVN